MTALNRTIPMRRVATGLLVVMAGLYILLRLSGAQGVFWGYARAFIEAAMVGGLADWFAVSALFRHPFGIPIPHTAIIPTNKDRIGDTLAVFMRENFLTARVVSRRMYRFDLAHGIGVFLSRPSHGDSRMMRGAARLCSDILQSLDQDRLGGLVKAGAAHQIRQLNLGPLLGQALSAAIADGRHLPLMHGLIGWASRTLEANEGLVREMVEAKAGVVLRWTGLDETLANAILKGLYALLEEMVTDPQHPMFMKAEQGLHQLAADLQHDPKMIARVAALRDSLLDNPALRRWLEGLWEAARSALLQGARDPEAALRTNLGMTIAGAAQQLGMSLQNNRRLRATLNRFARRIVVGITSRYGEAIVKLVSETIRSWDAKTMTDRLEQAVGRDLQYIRLNGTLVGGAIGLLIHGVDRLF